MEDGPSSGEWVVFRDWAGHRLRTLPSRARSRFFRWATTRRRFRRERDGDSDGSGLDLLDGAFGLADVGWIGLVVIGAVVAVIVLLVLWDLVLFGLVTALAEVLVLGLLALGTWAWFTVRRRPWSIVAERGTDRHIWHVHGFRSSARARDEIARRLASGHTPAQISPMDLDLWLAAQH
jgi:hypothetical protein